MALKCRVRDFNDFAIWYTPGVAKVCMEIHADKQKAYEYTNKWNSVAVISDGTRVLGLGDIGPEAALPVIDARLGVVEDGILVEDRDRRQVDRHRRTVLRHEDIAGAHLAGHELVFRHRRNQQAHPQCRQEAQRRRAEQHPE